MRRGPLSPLAVTLALMLVAPPVRAEEFDLLAFLRPRAPAVATVAAEPIPAGVVAPLPLPRPAGLDAAIYAAAIALSDGFPQILPASMPLPQRRPKIIAEPSLLMLQFPAATQKGTAAAASVPSSAPAALPAVAAPGPVAPAEPVAIPVSAPEPRPTAPLPAPRPTLVATPAPAPAPGTTAEQLVPPMIRGPIPLPQPRPVLAQAPGVTPTPVRTVAIPVNGYPRPAPAPMPVPAPSVATAPPPAPPALAPAAVEAVRDPAADPVWRVADVPPPELLAPGPLPLTEAPIAPVEAAEAATPAPEPTPAPVRAAPVPPAVRAAKVVEEPQVPALPMEPAMVAEAMLQRIPTVTSAIAGLVSAVSPASAYASDATGAARPGAQPGAGEPGVRLAQSQAQAAPPADVTRVERKQTGPAPYELVRKLQRLQDRIANGDTAALQGQRTLITEIELQFRLADPEVWQDPRNGRAAVIFFLSGGGPAELRNLLKLNPLPAVDERLLNGALAYMEGREDDAERYLGEINALRLPDALGGQIALAQAAVTVRKDPQKAMAMLDVARLMMPGTLVEEAALRREILVAAQIGDVSQFEQLSRQYLFRFRHSVYAGNFRQRFAAALTRMAFVNDPAQFSRLNALLVPLDRDSRVEIYLLVARGALNQGKLVAASLAAERVLAEAKPLSSDAERARVYRSAVRAASSKDVDVALAELNGADRTRLPGDDVMLLNAAITTAELVKAAGEISRPVSVAAPAKVDPMKLTAVSPGPALLPSVPAPAQSAIASAARPPAPAPAPVATAADDVSPAIVGRARGTLDQIDALLKEAPR